MYVLRLLRIFVPLLIVAAIVAGSVLVLTARSDLQRSRKQVDSAWAPLRMMLDRRYLTLASANDGLQSVPGPLHQLVEQVSAAYGTWHTLEQRNGSVSAEVVAANDLESLGRRLVLAARATPRLAANAAALAPVNAYAALTPPAAADHFDATVDSFEQARSRPARSLAARVLGYGAIPTYDSSGFG
ncbi:MAG: hypothetical protein ACLPVY_11745 [Acidimicrobiia bacterium]